MTDKLYKGYSVVTKTYCTVDEDGFWTVIQSIVESRSEDLENWETKDANLKVIDKDMQKAILNAHNSMNKYLASVNGDLFGDVVVEEKKEE